MMDRLDEILSNDAVFFGSLALVYLAASARDIWLELQEVKKKNRKARED